MEQSKSWEAYQLLMQAISSKLYRFEVEHDPKQSKKNWKIEIHQKINQKEWNKIKA